MSEFEMDGEGLVLPESPDSHKENCSMLSNGDTFSSSDIQHSDDGACKVISTGVEYKKSAAVCSFCSHSPSKEAPIDVLCMGSTPSSYSMDSKKSKFSCQTSSSQIHSKHSEEDHCTDCLIACLFCGILFLHKSISDATSCGRLNMYSCCREDTGGFGLPHCMDCRNLEESCVNSNCIDICSEHCDLCIPS